MGNAGTQDLRGVEVLPYALKIIGHPSDPALANAVAGCSLGGQRRAPDQPRSIRARSGNYDQSDAVRIMDAWWPLLVKAEFQPVLGPGLLDEIENDFPINDEPGHGASERTSARRSTSASTGSSRRTCARRSARRSAGR